jgi:hypothetical protein
MKSLLAITLLCSSLFAGTNVYSDQFQTIQSIDLYEVVESEQGEVENLVQTQKLPSEIEVLMAEAKKNRNKGLGEIIMATKQLIALGKEIYKIIEAGKPVVSVNSTPISVLPKDEKGDYVDAMNLSNWQMPKVKKFRVAAKNYLGMTPVSFEFMMIFTPGGKWNGKGAYLTSTQIKPTTVDVSWGYSVDATFKVQSIINQGSVDSPVAGAVLMIDYTIKTVLKESRNSRTFFVNGLGQAQAY